MQVQPIQLPVHMLYTQTNEPRPEFSNKMEQILYCTNVKKQSFFLALLSKYRQFISRRKLRIYMLSIHEEHIKTVGKEEINGM